MPGMSAQKVQGLKTLASVLAAALLVGATDRVHLSMDPVESTAHDQRFVPEPAYAKAFALGFEAVQADYHWIQVVQLVGGLRGDTREHADYIGSVIELVTELDPWVDHPYRFAAVWLTRNAADVTRANALLRRAIEHHPLEWRNYFYLGFNLFFYLGENAEAAEVLSAALPLQGTPAYLPALVARLHSSTADLEAAEVFLTQMLIDNEGGEREAPLRSALDEIEVERAARILDRARSAYQRLHGRDIEAVSDLVSGRHPILRRLPDAEPSSLPVALRRGSQWKLADGQIVSSYFDRRYVLHFSESERAENERIRAEYEERRLQEEQQAQGDHA